VSASCRHLLMASSLCACGTDRTACECTDPAARVRVPADRVAAVIDVKVSGDGCPPGTEVTCEQQTTTGCAVYRFAASAAGSCEIGVVFVDGMFTASVKFSPLTCCTGFFPDPPSAGDIDATRPLDAGGAG
jgi:hypothetical protein